MRFRVYAATALIAWSAGVVGAQKPLTPEELDKIMRRRPARRCRRPRRRWGPASTPRSKTQMATVRQAVIDSQPFWIEHKREDALKFNKDTLAKLDAFDKTLAAEPVDAAAAGAALKAVGAACRSCHQVYRATDADNNFILKPGSLGS